MTGGNEEAPPPVNDTKMRGYKAPPVYKEGKSYADWRLDIDLWNEFTPLPEKRRATAFLLELGEGKVKSHVRALGKENLMKDDGLALVIAKLDKIYKEDSSHETYRAYCKFEKYERPHDMNLQSYISEFEKMHADLTKYSINLPEEVLAYRLLNSANLPQEKVDLALATVKKLTYSDMSDTIGKIFSLSTAQDRFNDAITVKTEPQECNYASHTNWRRGSNRGYSSGPHRSRGHTSRGSVSPYPRGNGNRFRAADNVMCFGCGQRGHYARSCPNQQPMGGAQYFTQGETATGSQMDAEEPGSAYITLLAAESVLIQDQPVLSSLVFETFSCAVIDSGCTKTVVGRNWINQYTETLNVDEKKLIMASTKCSTPFKFGDGKQVISTEKTRIPGRIGQQKILIEANVVSCDIPLLLSKPSLKKAGAVINFNDDTMEFNGEKIKLMECKSGHYCVPICNRKRSLDDTNVKVVLTVTAEMLGGDDESEMKKKALKLHRQFAHAPSYKLQTLLKNAGYSKKSFMKVLDKVCETCEVCSRYVKPKPRPVVGLPRAKDFNDCVAMDLKTIEGSVTFLHMIDCATRFSLAKIIPNKHKETIVNALCIGWISLFGSPRRFMADNGGEFANFDFVEMCEQFNIEMQNSAAESPFSNGIVERHNKMLGEMTLKTKRDVQCTWEVALSWALSAKNSLQMSGGYSPYQLVMGKNPSLPNIIDNSLPAMEETSASKQLEDNLRAMRKAREEFVKAESSAKIKRAIKSQVRTCNDVTIENGEKVLYKRNNSDRWHGPGVVIGRDGQTFVVKHGFQIIKVHPCHISSRVGEKEKVNELKSVVEADGGSAKSKKETEQHDPEDISRFYREEIDVSKETVNAVENEEPQGSDQLGEEGARSPQSKEVRERKLPKVKTHVVFMPKHPEDEESDNWERAYVHSRAGKASGKYAKCFNIQLDGDENIQCVDWSELTDEWHEDCEEEPEQEVMLTNTSIFDQDVVDAKDAELEKFHDNNVYNEVENEGQSTIGVRWVVTRRKKTGEPKARLVALGYQERDKGLRADSPTCCKDSIRIVTLLSQCNGWKIQHIDVHAAFLQGKEISRLLFVKPPKEANTSKLWLLKKCMYGLIDGPRMWYVELRETLEKLKMDVSMFDESFFHCQEMDTFCGLIVIHVDDLMFSGNDWFITNVIGQLKNKFKLSTEVESAFVYTGLEIIQSFKWIAISQVEYINQLSELVIDKSRFKHNESPINDEERKQLRSVGGQLLWVATQTRPDVCYGTCIATNAYSSGTVKDLKLVNKTIKFMKNNPLTLKFPRITMAGACIVIFSDASFGNLPDGSSQGGHIVFIAEKSGRCCPVTWQSRKIRKVCKSTLAAESWALVDGLESAELIAAQLNQILKSQSISRLVCLTDCKSLYDAIRTTNTLDDKGLKIPLACLRQRFNRNEVAFVWVPTGLQLADCLTKAGAPSAILREVLSTGQLSHAVMSYLFSEL